MLIRCKECGKEISDKAQTCIHCGAPLKSDKQTVHVEATDKEIKVMQLVGGTVFTLGFFGTIFTKYTNFFGTVLIIGAVLIIYNGWKTWWRYR